MRSMGSSIYDEVEIEDMEFNEVCDQLSMSNLLGQLRMIAGAENVFLSLSLWRSLSDHCGMAGRG